MRTKMAPSRAADVRLLAVAGGVGMLLGVLLTWWLVVNAPTVLWP